MSHRHPIVTLLLLVALAGCQQSEPEVAGPAGEQSAAQTILPTKPDDKEAQAAAEREKMLQAMANYQTPFPNRADLFVPPKTGPSPRSSEPGEESVQLVGLVNVDEPRAILDIEGATTLLAVGGEKYGVKVIDIDNSNVTLERGRTRWTASLQ